MDLNALQQANQAFAAANPGESLARRPVHVVYGGAHLFQAGICRKLGDAALRSLQEYAPTFEILAEVTGMPREIAAAVYPRVLEKLQREPVEDYRIDFEDGYGNRADAEEDAHADAAAAEASKAFEAGTLPAFFGIRIKPLDEDLRDRSLRTLSRFLSAFPHRPPGFVVTLPKITVIEQVRTLVEAVGPDAGVELMVETPASLMSLREFALAAKCKAVHFGPYDYSATLGITSAHQTLTHPVCDFARSMMQMSLAGTGIGLADGPTTTLPIPPHRGEAKHGALHAENRATVHAAWKLHYEHVRRALGNGFYQGWDLHPAQLPIRYAAVFAFFVEGQRDASARMRNFMEKAAQATRIGSVFDDAATGQGLLNYFLRAIRCGAIPESSVPSMTGLTEAELQSASFTRILQARRASGERHGGDH